MTDKIETNEQKNLDTRPVGGRSGININTRGGSNFSVMEMLKIRDAEPTSENHTRTLIPAGTEHVVMNISDFRQQ